MANHDSEAWAVGTRDGAAVSSLDVAYHNNAKYYSDNASSAAARAEAAVPAGTSGAVFFDQAQTLTDAQQAQARVNIGAGSSAASIPTPLHINSLVYSTSGNVTTTNKWYRVATITALHYPVGFMWISGAYGNYRPAVTLLSFAASGAVVHSLVQLAGAPTTGIKQVRLVQLTNGLNQYAIEVYYNSKASNGTNSISIMCTGEKIELTAPTLAYDTPADGKVTATLTLAAINTGIIQLT